MSGVNYFSSYSSSTTCGSDQTRCGDSTSDDNFICIPNTYATCPVTDI